MIRVRTIAVAQIAIFTLTMIAGLGGAFAASSGKGSSVSVEDLPKYPTQLYAALAELPADVRHRLLVEGAKKEGKVVGYMSGGVPTLEAIKKAFEKKYPFIEFEYWRGRTAQVIEKVLAEQRAGKLQPDIIKVSEMHVLQNAGLTTPYSSPAKSVLNDKYMGKDWQSLTINPVVPAYNTDMLSAEEAPKSYEDFLNPKWKGKFALDIRPDKSMLSIYEKMGHDGGREFMKKLVANDPVPMRGHTAAVKAMAAGEFPLVFEAYGYKVANLNAEANAPLEWIAVDPIVFIGGLFTISNQARHPYAAALFTDYLLSEEAQRIYGEAEGRPMVHPDVPPANKMAAQMLKAPNLIPINPRLFRQHWDAISKDMEEIVAPAMK
jgi:iron(III) transport system substrate-binding protein